MVMDVCEGLCCCDCPYCDEPFPDCVEMLKEDTE